MRPRQIPEPVVVLGGGGFIGSHLARRLEADGYDVVAVDVDFPLWREQPSRRLRADLLDPAVSEDVVAGAGCVIHLAADMGGVGYFHSDADLGAALTNGRITANVLEACVRAGTTRLVYASSACAYPVSAQQSVFKVPRLREAQLGLGMPDQLYGAEKLHGLRLCAKVPGARVAVLFTVFGAGQDWETDRAKFPPSVVRKALEARESGVLALWGDGSQMRSYLHVDDAVDRLLVLASSDRYEGPVNVGAEGAVSCRAVAGMCLDLAGVPDAEVVLEAGRPSGVMARDCDLAKWRRVYGEPSQRPLRAGFAELMVWMEGQMAGASV